MRKYIIHKKDNNKNIIKIIIKDIIIIENTSFNL